MKFDFLLIAKAEIQSTDWWWSNPTGPFKFGAVLGIILGLFIGLRQYSFWDFSLTGLSFVGISMPAFVAGIFGLYLFSVRWHLFPSGGMQTVGQASTFFDSLHHLILPSEYLYLSEMF